MLLYLDKLFSHFTSDPALIYFMPKIFIALVCGTVLGMERELQNKNAGMKTLMLICLGSTLFSCCSLYIQNDNTDNSRIIAQIVSGIGFLGAGVIIQSRGALVGLTSAAIIWFTAALGPLIAFNLFELAIILTVVCVFFLTIYRLFEQRYLLHYEGSSANFYTLKMTFPEGTNILEHIKNTIKDNGGVVKAATTKIAKHRSNEIMVKYSAPSKKNKQIYQELSSIKDCTKFLYEESITT